MRLRGLLITTAICSMAGGFAAPAMAEGAADPASNVSPVGDVTVSEVVVTATRRDTNLQTTPIAVSAVDQKLIAQSNPRDLGDLSVFVPNFSAATITGFNAASFSIRGVGQNNIIVYFEPPVGVLVDDFVMPSVQTQLLDTFDVEQVEVLRGPQGTLFGKNTTGGAVTVRTKKPVMDLYSVEGRAMLGSYGTKNFAGAVNVPILKEQLALRAAIGHESTDGYYKNGACYGPVTAFVPSKFAGVAGCGDGSKLGGTDVLNGRVKLRWQPTSDFDALLQYEFLRDRSDSIPTVSDTPNSPNFLFSTLGVGASNPAHSDPLDNAGISNRQDGLIKMRDGQRIDVNGVYLNMNWDTPYGAFTSVTGQRKQNSRLPNTYTGQAPVAADGEVLSLFDANRSDDRKTFQQEVRFASHLGGPFDFVTGLFYQKDDVDFCVAQILGFLDLVSGPLPFGSWNQNPYLLCNAQHAKSKAAYFEGTYKVTDKLTVTGGARYTDERKTWWGRQQVFVQQLNGGFDPSIHINDALDASVFNYPAGVIQVHSRSTNPTWRASVSYQATPETFVYGTFVTGFKGGGFNDQIGSGHPFVNPDGTDDQAAFAQAAQATQPEKARSWEVGFKTEGFDRRVRLNVTGFYVNYDNPQKQIVVPIVVGGQPNQVTRFFNAASATVKGLEAEATAVPVEGLTLRAVVGYQEGKYNEYITPVPAGYDLASAPLDRLPKWQWTLDANYDMPLGSAYKLSFNGNVNFTGRNLFTQSITSPSENTYLNARTLLNMSVTLADMNDRYYVRLVGRNLGDKRYKTAEQVVGGLWSNSQYGPPRFVGVEAGFKFDRAR